MPALRAWLADVADRGELQVTEGARRVFDLFQHPPAEAEWRPVLPLVARLAAGTLPPVVREMYGVRMPPAREAAMRATLALIKAGRPLLPRRFRYLAPYNEWAMRERGVEVVSQVERSRRNAGIRLGPPAA